MRKVFLIASYIVVFALGHWMSPVLKNAKTDIKKISSKNSPINGHARKEKGYSKESA